MCGVLLFVAYFDIVIVQRRKDRKMKYILRRAILGIITTPIALTAYAILYFGIGILAATQTASVGAFIDNAWSVGIAWVLVIAFARQILDIANKVTH